tara:strand:- start:8 stop:412 length:405 start_codon:yes stop_codon:yes gene_type:complete
VLGWGEFPPHHNSPLLNTINTMANVYKNAMFDLTTTNKTTVYTCPTDRTTLIKSIQITNIHSGAVEVEAFVTDASNSNAEHEVAHISLGSKTVENLVKGTMVLESGDALKLEAASANNIAGIVSYLEIFDEKSA